MDWSLVLACANGRRQQGTGSMSPCGVGINCSVALFGCRQGMVARLTGEEMWREKPLPALQRLCSGRKQPRGTARDSWVSQPEVRLGRTALSMRSPVLAQAIRQTGPPRTVDGGSSTPQARPARTVGGGSESPERLPARAAHVPGRSAPLDSDQSLNLSHLVNRSQGINAKTRAEPAYRGLAYRTRAAGPHRGPTVPRGRQRRSLQGRDVWPGNLRDL